MKTRPRTYIKKLGHAIDITYVNFVPKYKLTGEVLIDRCFSGDILYMI